MWLVGDNKYIVAECQQGVQLKGRPVIRTSRYSLVVQTSSFQSVLSVELHQRSEQEICAQLLPFVPAQLNDLGHTCTLGHCPAPF